MARPHAASQANTIGYLRVSTEEQAKDEMSSLDEQRRAVAGLAERLGRSIGPVFEDPGVSGATAEDRPGFMAMVAHCQAHPRSRSSRGCVLVLNDSRWGRFYDSEEAAYWRVELRRVGWDVRFAEGGETTDPLVEPLLRAVHGTQSTAYREAIRANAKRGARATAEQGYWQTEAPVGYRRQAYRSGQPSRMLGRGERKADDEKVRLTPGPEEERELIVWMFTEYASGRASLGELSRRAREQLPVWKWSRQSIARILRNPAYVGNVVWCRRVHDKLEREEIGNVRDRSEWVIVQDAHPALISHSLFARVHTQLAVNRKTLRATHGGYPLSGLIRCAHCGEPYVGAGGPKGPPGDPDRYRFYRDRGGVEPNVVCAGILGTLQRRLVEPQVLDVIGEVVAQPAVQELIAEEFDRALTSLEGSQRDQRTSLSRDVERLEGERRRIVQAIGRGVLTDADAAGELATLRNRIDTLTAQQDQLRFTDRRTKVLAKERKPLLEMAADFPAMAKRLSGSALRELLRPWLQDAVVNKVNRTLTLTIRRIPKAGMFLLLSPSPGRGSP